MTCFLSDRYDYDYPEETSGDETRFYLQQMKELDAEAGRSLDYKGNITLQEKETLSKNYFLNSFFY